MVLKEVLMMVVVVLVMLLQLLFLFRNASSTSAAAINLHTSHQVDAASTEGRAERVWGGKVFSVRISESGTWFSMVMASAG